MIFRLNAQLSKSFLRSTLMLGFLFFITQVSEAQVTIGSSLPPDKDALIDFKQAGVTKGGLLLPRVALQQTTLSNPLSAHTEGMLVYNTATAGDVTPGSYYNDGIKWIKNSTGDDSFFYMPSTTLSIDESDPSFANGMFTVNLYNSYKEQFGLTATNIVASDLTARLPVHNNNELYYFITYYDDTVFDDVKISPLGVLTYKIKAGFTYSEKTYMNIIFKVK